MTKSVGVHEAKTHLSKLLEQVEAGEEVEITRRGTVVARLVPAQRRVPIFGWAHGQFTVPDDFDDEDPELIALFEDGPIFPDDES